MSYTTYLNLENLVQGQTDWHTVINSNMAIIDTLLYKISLTDGSSGLLTAGMPVYISANSTVNLANATTTAKPTIGFCTYTNGTTAKVHFCGVIIDAVTVGAADIVAGDLLYLSTTAGKVTRTKPTGGGNLQQIVGRALKAESSSKVDLVILITQNYGL